MYLSPTINRPVPRAPIPKHPYHGITYQFIKALAAAQLRERRIEAARRAISLLNKMRPSDFRGRYTSRAFSNLNKLRAA